MYSYNHKIRIAVLFVAFLLSAWNMAGQISYGGSPLLGVNNHLRAGGAVPVVSMPAFDLDSLLRIEAQQEDDWQRSHTFAYKFYTDIDIRKEFDPVVLDDGTRVWQLKIHSQDALSINLLFSRYHLPEGAALFIYSTDYNQIIGKFDHRNNSSLGLLPVRPVLGEAVIIEYSEPAHAAFEGEVVVGEVNHGYRDFFAELRAGREPGYDTSAYRCMPDALCEDGVDESIIRSTVLLIIEGTYSCTGVMVNNTNDDKTPYMLTAVHCMNASASFPKQPEYYVDKAGTIIAFFNYNRPVCGSSMKATEEMSLAVAHPRAIIEKKDIALLEFEETPPVHYNVYYAGWDMQGLNNQSPYVNLHHPSGSVKKYGQFDESLILTDYYSDYGSNNSFDSKTHWKISGWTVGSTDAGASGSPLFNNENLVVGTLTGGESRCKGVLPDGAYDYFSALYKAHNSLSPYLDPLDTGALTHAGLDPHKDNPLYRISNADYNHGDELITSEHTSSGNYIFGNGNPTTCAFAEEFNLENGAELQGVYVYIPRMPFSYTQDVKIEVYGGTTEPETLLASTTFIPQYLGYGKGEFDLNDKNTNVVPTESFVSFDTPVKVDKKFFVVYRINASSAGNFVVYNTQFASSEKKNTAWIRLDDQKWIEATNYEPFKQKTSLAIQALVRYKSDVAIDMPESDGNSMKIAYDRTSRTVTLIPEKQGSAEVVVYSVAGQMLEKRILSTNEQSFRLREQPSGSVGIVKIIAKNGNYIGKIIY